LKIHGAAAEMKPKECSFERNSSYGDNRDNRRDYQKGVRMWKTALIWESVNPLCGLHTLNLIATLLNADILQVSM